MNLETKKLIFRQSFLFSLDDEPNENCVLKTITKDEYPEVIRFLTSKKMENLFIPFCKANEIEIGELENIKFLTSRNTHFLNQEIAIYQIQNILDSNQIRYMFLKGGETRSFYKKPIYRVSNDLDILVDKENVDKVAQILINSMNGEFEIEGLVHNSFFLLNKQVRVELHKGLFADLPESNFNGFFDRPFDNVYPDLKHPYRFHFNHSYGYVYLLGHLFKHCKSDGFYAPPLMDIWLYKNSTLYNKEEVDNYLKETKLEKFENILSSLLLKYRTNEDLTDLENKLENYILEDGDTSNLLVSKYKYNSKFDYIKSRLFLKRESLETIYPNLKKHKKLIFFYQIKRWFRALFQGKLGKTTKQINDFSHLNENTIKDNEELFSKIGL